MKSRIQKGLRLAAISLFLISIFFIYGKFSESMIPELDSGSVPFAKEIVFGVTVDAASYEMGSGKGMVIDTDGAKEQIDLISELGADAVRLNLEKNALEDASEREKLDGVMDHIRGKKMAVILAYQGRESWSGPGRGKGKADWGEFKEGYKEDVVFIMERYDPEYLLILPGCPSDIGRQVNSEKTSGEWSEFAKEAGLAAKQISFSANVILEGSLSSDGERARELEFAEAALGSNDISINIFSISAGDIEELEAGIENLLALKKKYHWDGGVWMGNVRADFSDDTAKQEDFLLYSLYLANSNGFSGAVVGNLADGKGDQGGILGGDYAPKASYTAIKEVMARRDQLFYSE
jgi:hypothetical protein